MPNGDPTYEGIVEILMAHDFALSEYKVDDEPTQVLYIKSRAGVDLPVTVPMDCTGIPDETIRQIMQTAHVPEPEYLHLLSTP